MNTKQDNKMILFTFLFLDLYSFLVYYMLKRYGFNLRKLRGKNRNA